MFGVANAIVPTVARANSKTGVRAASIAGMKMGLHGVFLVVPYLLGVLCLPTYALTVFYGRHSGYLSLGGSLRLMCCSYLFLYAGLLLSTVLSALERPRLSFNGQCASSMMSITVGLPLAATLGVAGAAAGNLFGNATRAISQVISLQNVIRESEL